MTYNLSHTFWDFVYLLVSPPSLTGPGTQPGANTFILFLVGDYFNVLRASPWHSILERVSRHTKIFTE